MAVFAKWSVDGVCFHSICHVASSCTCYAPHVVGMLCKEWHALRKSAYVSNVMAGGSDMNEQESQDGVPAFSPATGFACNQPSDWLCTQMQPHSCGHDMMLQRVQHSCCPPVSM
jgi:hypothetical protein